MRRLKPGIVHRFRQWLGETADHRLRYAEVLHQLALERPARVLEVGSGPVGLARYWSGGVVGVDVAFPTPTARGLRPTVAPATKLPFEDASFPVVISIDMLEHLPAADRATAIAEMFRVAQGTVIIAVPAGPAARAAEARLLKAWRGPLPGWLTEHQQEGLPDVEAIRQAIQEAAGDRQLRLSETSGGSCETWLKLTRNLDRPFARFFVQRFWLASWSRWRGRALRGEPYRTVFVCRFAAAPVPAGVA